MGQQVCFRDLFLDYTPPETLLDSVPQMSVVKAEIDRPARSIRLQLTSEDYITEKNLELVRTQIEERYGLKTLTLDVSFPPEALAQMDFYDLSRVFVRAYSPAAAILAGAKWELDGETLTIRLQANGRQELLDHVPKAERYLEERFGLHKHIEIESNHAVEGKALFAETERIRREALKNVQLAPQQPAAPQRSGGGGGGRSAAASEPTGDLFFGKPFHGEKVPIRDLNLDMFRVVVEGKVFAVNHRELKKRNAWVVCFDVTDYTGSVRVNQFMESAKAKPILDQIAQPGMWVRIQGKMTFDRYDNEMVMQPNSIQKIKTPKREDTAKDKRVELHLHTTMSSMDALTDTAAAVSVSASMEDIVVCRCSSTRFSG